MKCPDCNSEVGTDVIFCFTCLRHVPAELLIASDEETAAVASQSKLEAPRSKGSWEPGLLGTVQAFGRAASNSGWRRNKVEGAR